MKCELVCHLALVQTVSKIFIPSFKQFHPISKSGSNLTRAGGVGYTIVDALDSLLVMDLRDEYKRARDWVRTELTFDRDGEYNTFEVRSCWASSRFDRLKMARY